MKTKNLQNRHFWRSTIAEGFSKRNSNLLEDAKMQSSGFLFSYMYPRLINAKGCVTDLNSEEIRCVFDDILMLIESDFY